MKKIILIPLSIIFLFSCSAIHDSYHSNEDDYVHQEVLEHSYVDKDDHIVIIVKHRHKLKNHQKRRLKRWCNRHYRHHKKNAKFKFILG